MSSRNKLHIQITGNIIFSIFLLSVLILTSISVFNLEYNKVLFVIWLIILIVVLFSGFTLRYEYDNEYLEIRFLLLKKIKIPLKELKSITNVSISLYLLKYRDTFLLLFLVFGKKTLGEFVKYVKERNSSFQSDM
jgi:hypothetical protein